MISSGITARQNDQFFFFEFCFSKFQTKSFRYFVSQWQTSLPASSLGLDWWRSNTGGMKRHPFWKAFCDACQWYWAFYCGCCTVRLLKLTGENDYLAGQHRAFACFRRVIYPVTNIQTKLARMTAWFWAVFHWPWVVASVRQWKIGEMFFSM